MAAPAAAQAAGAPDGNVPAAERASDLVGYVDAVAGRRVFGWAWDRARPDARIELQVYAGEALLGTAIAARERADLRATGIGDGRHAFEFELPESLDPAAPIEVRALRPESGETVALGRPPRNGAAAKASDALSADAAARLEAAQRALRRDLRAVAAEIRRLAGPDAERERERDELGRRLQNLEVHLVRLDSALRELNRTMAGRAEERPPRRLLIAAAGVGALSALSLLVGLVNLMV